MITAEGAEGAEVCCGIGFQPMAVWFNGRKPMPRGLSDGPAEFGRGGAGVVVAFFGVGAEDAAGDFLVKAFAVRGLEGFFHAAIFAGMEGEDGEAAAGIQALGQNAQETVERGEFLVHCNADGLEDAADGEFAFVLTDCGKFTANGGGEVCRGEKRLSGQGWGEMGGVRIVGVFGENGGEFFRRHFLQELRGRNAGRNSCACRGGRRFWWRNLAPGCRVAWN